MTNELSLEQLIALESYFEEYAYEGANTDSNKAYKSAIKDGKIHLNNCKNYMKKNKYAEAKASAVKARDCFQKGFNDIKNIKDTIGASILSGFISDIIGSRRIFKEAKELKQYNSNWTTQIENSKYDRKLRLLGNLVGVGLSSLGGGLSATGAISKNLGTSMIFGGTMVASQNRNRNVGPKGYFKSKDTIKSINDFKQDLADILYTYIQVCNGLIKELDSKMKNSRVQESFYTEDDDMDNEMSMMDLIKLEAILIHEERATEGTNAKLTFGYVKAMKDGKKFLEEAENLTRIKNYKDARDNVFKARKCFLKVHSDIDALPDSKISNAIGRLMSATVGTYRLFKASENTDDYYGGKITQRMRNCASARKIIMMYDTKASGSIHLDRFKRSDTLDGKITHNFYKKDMLSILEAYIEICEIMMKDLSRLDSNQTKAEEAEFLMPSCGEPATEGKNIDASNAFNKHVTSGKKNLHKANMLVQQRKFKEAKECLKDAKKDFEDGIDDIHKIPNGILADWVIQSFASLIVGTYKIFAESGTIKMYGDKGRDWGIKLFGHGVARVLGLLLDPLGFVNTGERIVRRVENTNAEARRDKKKPWTFNGFKEDLMFILNAYVETTEELIERVEEFESMDSDNSNAYYSLKD